MGKMYHQKVSKKAELATETGQPACSQRLLGGLCPCGCGDAPLPFPPVEPHSLSALRPGPTLAPPPCTAPCPRVPVSDVPVSRCSRVPVSPCPRIPVFPCPGASVSRCPRVPVSLCSVSPCPGVPVPRCPCVRCPGVSVSRCPGVPVPTHDGAAAPAVPPDAAGRRRLWPVEIFPLGEMRKPDDTNIPTSE